jgi:hypothetical protein
MTLKSQTPDLTITQKPNVTVCHCDMCRRWSSGPYMAITCQQDKNDDGG